MEKETNICCELNSALTPPMFLCLLFMLVILQTWSLCKLVHSKGTRPPAGKEIDAVPSLLSDESP